MVSQGARRARVGAGGEVKSWAGSGLAAGGLRTVSGLLCGELGAVWGHYAKTEPPSLTLRDAFYGPEAYGIAPPKVLAKLAGVSVEEAKHFIQHWLVHQQFKKIDKQSLFVPITADPHTWQADLMF